jgi:hypothetical protein
LSFRIPLQYDDEASVGSLPKVFGDKCGTGGRAFSRNALDTFILKGQTDVGRMKQLEVSHDDTGLGAGECRRITVGGEGVQICRNSERDEREDRPVTFSCCHIS